MKKKYRIRVVCSLPGSADEFITHHELNDDEQYEYTTIRWDTLKKHEMNKVRIYEEEQALTIMSDLQAQEDQMPHPDYVYKYIAEPVYIL